MMRLCVFCSSSDAAAPGHFAVARELGREIALRGHELVYGGTDVGLMGAVARAARETGGRVVGIVPTRLRELGLAAEGLTELIETRDLRDRKALMDQRSDAFLALPGGLGTLEEVVEALNLKFLGYHQKPLVLINPGGFYEPLLELLRHFYRERMTKPAVEQLFACVPDVPTAFAHLEAYQPVETEEKWFRQPSPAGAEAAPG